MATSSENWPDEFAQDVKEIAEMAYNLSGDWVTPIDCDTIMQRAADQSDDIAVFFGKRETLDENVFANQFTKLSQNDRYNYEDHLVSFHINEDDECRE